VDHDILGVKKHPVTLTGVGHQPEGTTRTISCERPACVDKYYRPVSFLRSKRTGTPFPDRISRTGRRGLFALGSAQFSNEVDDADVAVQVATGLDLIWKNRALLVR
jgi:hypothetical protein